jgi:hypothetical protein
LASASDDLQIILWDWALNQAAVAYESEHHSNVFQVNFFLVLIFQINSSFDFIRRNLSHFLMIVKS